MSKQMIQLVEAEEIENTKKMNNIDIIAELDYIYEQEERARVARQTEHKIAMKQVALKHTLVCTLILQ